MKEGWPARQNWSAKGTLNRKESIRRLEKREKVKAIKGKIERVRRNDCRIFLNVGVRPNKKDRNNYASLFENENCNHRTENGVNGFVKIILPAKD